MLCRAPICSPAPCGSTASPSVLTGARDELARDVVRVLREELHFLLAKGAALVQFDEPVLSEVVFGSPSGGRSFMCGALAEKMDTEEELAFAGDLINQVVKGLPMERLALPRLSGQLVQGRRSGPCGKLWAVG